jgi:hypothetical protein
MFEKMDWISSGGEKVREGKPRKESREEIEEVAEAFSIN